jgi:hypothetical protein
MFFPFVPGRPSQATRAGALSIEPSSTPAAVSSSLGFVWTYHGEWRSECATRDRLFSGSMTRATPRNWFSETTGRSQWPATRYGENLPRVSSASGRGVPCRPRVRGQVVNLGRALPWPLSRASKAIWLYNPHGSIIRAWHPCDIASKNLEVHKAFAL